MVLNILDFRGCALQSDSKEWDWEQRLGVAGAAAAAGEGDGLPSYEAAKQQQQMHTGTADEVSFRETNATWQDMSFSMDLLTCARREANFLRMIDRIAPVLYEDQVTSNAVRRYEQFWLPLQVSFAFISEFSCHMEAGNPQPAHGVTNSTWHARCG